MRLEIDIPEHHYNNIMAIDSVSLGRVPYKGIIIYAINAIKHGRVLEQEPTTKNSGVDCIDRKMALDTIQMKWKKCSSGDDAMQESIDAIREMPSVTPHEPKTGQWDKDDACPFCGYLQQWDDDNYCGHCGAKMEG